MRIWDAMCGTLLSTGARRGAMMATLRCDHPDIEEFVTAKQQRGQLRRFNLSVQVTDAFIAAVRSDDVWPLMFPAVAFDGDGETIWRDWPGEDRPVPCRVTRRVGARQLWERILRATYDYAEPGVLFIDRINHLNNLWYRERLTATIPAARFRCRPTAPATWDRSISPASSARRSRPPHGSISRVWSRPRAAPCGFLTM
jgi:ribonucleoside-diphosphate reductase alpha chain